jgi:hypothetical protein
MEKLMRHYGFAIATASVVALGSLSAGRAEAAPIGAPGGMRPALKALSITEKAQVYVYLAGTIMEGTTAATITESTTAGTEGTMAATIMGDIMAGIMEVTTGDITADRHSATSV